MKTIKLINRSSESKNLQISPISSPFFEFIYNKKSKIAPGLHETVQVKFLPNGYSYFSAQLRVRYQNSGSSRFGESQRWNLPKIPVVKARRERDSAAKNDATGKNKRSGKVVLIPIEAYPRMNIFSRERYLPSIIGKFF